MLTPDGRITDPYRNFIATSRYARWLEKENRRETWTETVDRYFTFMTKELGDKADPTLVAEIREAVLNHKIMPSMRAVMTAGPALDRNHIAAYNCAFLPVDDLRAFDETLYVLSCGTGVGYSVESKYVSKLPIVSEAFSPTETIIQVADSKEGWAKAYRELLALLWAGQIPQWDVSKVRPRGARLKTFGGRASGPAPLVDLFEFTINVITGASGRKITPLEAHDLMCKIGDVIVSGGVRRSALISLSDLNDYDMSQAKSGSWWEQNEQRALANNSAVYEGNPSMEQFMSEWNSLYSSRSGERGIVNRQAMREQAEKNGRRDGSKIAGTNPCSEIILRPYQFCNLSEVVVDPTDTLEELQNKVRLAAILGTWQSKLTKFKYIRKIWRTNTEEERLLGVSLTGPFGHKVLNTNNAKLVEWLTTLKETAVETNKEEALRIGIPQSAAVTCVKPSGCRPGNGLVTTHEGIYTLDELLEHHPQNDGWANTDLTSVQGDKISRTYRNGRSEVWKVALTHGMEVESTPNHQWWVKGMRKRNRTGWDSDFIPGWYRTDEIVPEHVLDLNLGVYEGTNDAQLIASTKLLYHNVVTRKTPSRLTPDFGWMLGYLWGDGSFSPHKNRIRFVDHSKSNLEKVQNIFQEYFGYDGTIQRASDRDAYEYTVASVEVYNFFVANGFWKYREGGGLADIPLKVRESTHETILAFIAGMIDSDGCVFRRGERRNISISTADKNFAKHLQDVALTVGIGLGRSLNTEGTNFQEQKSMWLLTANSLTVASRFEMSMKHSVKATNHLPELAWVPLISQYQHIGGKVVSVGFDRFEDTYDVEVENSHWFYAGAVKSHNTVSQLTGVSSGLHPWHNDHYIRTVRGSNDDPLTQFMSTQGIPSEPDVMNPDATTVFSFPVKAPKGAVTRNDLTAIEHLELWLTYQRHWCEHKPSVTISVREEEWLEVGAWVYKHFDELSGVSFLPHSEHTYQQAPYQDITEDQYKKALAEFPKDIHWEDLPLYEIEDATTGTQELSCTAGACEIVSIGDAA